jgi:hypothetical protein
MKTIQWLEQVTAEADLPVQEIYNVNSHVFG